MQKHRYKSSFMITLFLYALFIGCYIYLNKYSRISIAAPQKTKIIKLSLNSFVPPAPPLLPAEPDIPDPIEKPILHKVMHTQPLPQPEVVKPQIKPKPHKRKKHKKKTVQKNIHKLVEEPVHTRETPAVKTPVLQKVPINNQATRERFLSKIRTKIDQAKTYPRMAKKRRIQGIVQVSFTLTNTGDIKNLSVTGPKVFHSSAKKAIMSAFPVDVANAPVTLPLDIRLKLHYQIH